MYLIKKQRENGEAKPVGKDTEVRSDTVQDNVKNAADTAPGNQKAEVCTDSSCGSTDKTAGENDKSKETPSETDALKFYLKQSLEELKKQKDENEKLKSQLEDEKSQLDQLKDKLDGIVREYDNYRRRTAAEKENLGIEATSKAVLALLPALDNLERAMPFADSNPESFKKGVEMTLRQLSEAFKTFGVEEIEAHGAIFNPEFHEAVMHVEDESLGESVVSEVFQKGYRLGEKIVRHSVVKVAN
jgi:molecular chaperone GrpE